MSIASKGYVANADEIHALSKTILAAEASSETGRGTYLRALVATTQKELGAKPRSRGATGRKAKISDAGIAEQVAALNAVHERFYEAVTRAASEGLPGGTARAPELNRRTNFARSSLSTVRSWIKAGNDVTTLVVGRLTKSALRTERAVRPKQAGRLRRSVEARSKAFMVSVLELAEADKPAALNELELLIGQLTTQMVTLGGTAVTSAARATAEHRPLKMGGRMFIPVTETQVLRQLRQPS